ncbi:MAG TPA: hypothetical protein VFM33_13845 [Aquabacterium sp.]|nr:hypothetical protein [Aquabacterium sp.]
MTTQLAPLAVQRFYDNSGALAVGGKVYTYAAGTSTPVATYADSTGGTPNPNPLTLNSRGEGVFWLTPGQAYKFTVYDSLNNLLWSADNVTGADAAALTLAANLSSTTDASKGDFLIGVKRTDIASAAALTLHDWNQAARVNVRQVGVTGDGSTDDAALLNTLGALGVPLFIPYTSTGYKIGSTVTFSCDVYCEGFFTPTSEIGSAGSDYNRFAVVIAASAYADKRFIVGLKVAGSVALRAANVSGIRIDCANSILIRCMAYQLNYGIVPRMYSITLQKCSAWQCNTNLSAYARDSSHEFNALTIDGGNWDSAVNVAMNLGDTSWSDALAAGNVHGSCINIINGANTDGAESHADNVGGLNIEGVYAENTNTDCLWRLGGSGDGNIRGVRVVGCFLKTASYAIKCVNAVDGLEVGPNFLAAITSAEVKMSSDIYGLRHKTGTYAGCFGNGPGPVALAFRSVAINSVQFGNISIESDGITKGSQDTATALTKYYPGGVFRSGAVVTRSTSSASCAFYTSPATGKAGTVASNVFTFTTKSDCYSFNGGDRIVTAPAGATYVRSVDYVNGTMVLDGGTTANGAATVSQQSVTLRSETTTYSGAAPASGSWNQGDHAVNGTSTVGQPKGWYCTASGTPGTWVSEGNL